MYLTNIDKIYFPEPQYTKNDVLNYYEQISKVLLPYLYDRPLMVRRFPEGVHNKGFFQENFEAIPKFATTYNYVTNYFFNTVNIICQNKSTLTYLANKATIEFHTWHSRLTNTQRPDYAVIELKPINTNFEKVIAVALAINDLLNKLEVKPSIKTSSEDELHIYIPLGNLYTYKQAYSFAKLISIEIHKRIPSITTLSNVFEDNNGKVLINFKNNVLGGSVTAPYTLNATPTATVSTPITWDEVDNNLNPRNFTLKSVPLRLKERGDVWKDALTKNGIDMIEVLEQWTF